MPANDWPTGSIVKRDHDEEIVQAAVADDETRKGLLDGIEDAKTDGDEPGIGKLTTLLHEADRRRHVRKTTWRQVDAGRGFADEAGIVASSGTVRRRRMR